jgi:hypothetical protein
MLDDGDIGSVVAATAAHHTDPPLHAALYERILRAFEDGSLAIQYDAQQQI